MGITLNPYLNFQRRRGRELTAQVMTSQRRTPLVRPT